MFRKDESEHGGVGGHFSGLQSQEVVELELQADRRCPKWYHCYILPEGPQKKL